MKLIAVLMAILIILEPVGVPNAGRTDPSHRLISDAVSAGKIQKKISINFLKLLSCVLIGMVQYKPWLVVLITNLINSIG